MSATKIEWTEQTWNPVTGCTKVSAGCKHCYAETIQERFHGRGSFGTIECHDDRLSIPLRRRKPTMYFVNSMSDLFHESVPFEFIDKVFAVMALCPQHTFQVLTKRPERMVEYTARGDIIDAVTQMGGLEVEGAMPLRNVWLGTSVENQETADERIPHLLGCPEAVRFLSIEPMLERIVFRGPGCPWCFGRGEMPVPPQTPCPQCFSIGWGIFGCESGPKRRPCEPDWVRFGAAQFAAAGIPYFIKQLSINNKVSHDPSEWPADLRVREWPSDAGREAVTATLESGDKRKSQHGSSERPLDRMQGSTLGNSGTNRPRTGRGT